MSQKFDISAVYDDVQMMPDKDVDTHYPFTLMAAQKRVNIICQKPTTSSPGLAAALLQACNTAGVGLFIHENFRWQAPIRAFKKTMDSGVIGPAFKARVSFVSAFPFYNNQPFLAQLEHFILTDIGSHVLDICWYLFGEAKKFILPYKKSKSNIKGEDVANVLMEMETACIVLQRCPILLFWKKRLSRKH